MLSATPRTVALPLHVAECSDPHAQSGLPCGEPALALRQVQQLAQLYRLEATVKGRDLSLNVMESGGKAGVYGIGTPAQFERGGELYFLASPVLNFISQVADGAYFTATPRLTLHSQQATLDMGPLAQDQLRNFFSNLSLDVVQQLVPSAFEQQQSCDGNCLSPGITSVIWVEQPQRLRTGLEAGEVALIVTTGPQPGQPEKLGFITSVAVVEADGWATFYLPTAPQQWVTDPEGLRLTPANEGHALMVRLTHTPIQQLTEKGIVPPATLTQQ